jgi:hypothetical protein
MFADRLAELSDDLVFWVVGDGPEGVGAPKPDLVGGWAAAGLVVRSVRGAKCRTVDRMFDEVSAAWQFPDYFGENWPAFYECISELDWLDFGRGLVFVVRQPDVFLVDDPGRALKDLVDVLQDAHSVYREAIALGERWDRPAVPFHVVLQSTRAQRATAVGRWEAAGALLKPGGDAWPPVSASGDA